MKTSLLRTEICEMPGLQNLIRVGLLLGALFVGGVAGVDAQTGRVQPDRLTFGMVTVGATVEGSVRVVFEGSDTKGLSVSVKPPGFVRVQSTRLDTEVVGNRGVCVVCDIVVSLDTEIPELWRDEIQIEVGEQSTAVPVSAHVTRPDPKSTKVLVLGSPFNRFSSSNADDFEPWLKLVESARLNVNYLEIREGRTLLRSLALTDFDVILLSAEALVMAQDSDFDQFDAYLEAGGRIVVPTSHFMLGSVEKANHLLATYGLEMLDSETGGQPHAVVARGQIAEDPLTAGVEQLVFFRPSPVRIDSRTKTRALAKIEQEEDLAYAAVAPAGRGEVVVVACPIWWNWMSPVPGQPHDNSLFFGRLLTKPRASVDEKP